MSKIAAYLQHRCSMRSLTLAIVALTLAGCTSESTPARAQNEQAAAPLHTPLDDYIARAEPAYKWEKTGQQANGPVTTYDLKVTSQEWQGTTWTHRVQIFRPAQLKFPNTAMVLASFGGGSLGESFIGQAAANATGATVINVFQIPNQPLFGQREDALIALTFAKYLETGDGTWPLLFPMTKSVVKAMDAVEEFSTQEWKQPLNKFIVGGASKRGWTSWLVGAVDKRVIGIIPTVYDNLNLGKQMPHQLEVWGEYSPQIQDYTRIGLQEKMNTPRGQELSRMVDPWTYRERLTIPKLIVNATNDPYWPLDASSLYRDDLKGPTNFLYIANAGHSMDGQEPKVAASAAAWFGRVAGGAALPTVELTGGEAQANGSRQFTVRSTPANVQLWVAQSATQDFRKARWQAVPTDSDEAGIYLATAPALAEGMKYAAAFAEIGIAGDNPLLVLRASSPVVVWSTP